jgi:hypothetical protein
MPEFEIVALQEAKSQRKYISEYASYIHQISQGQAGKLHLVENENPATIRKRLVLAAQAVDITLVIRRSGQDIYFWIEQPVKPAVEERPQRRRGRRPRTQQEVAPQEQPVSEPELPPADTAPDLAGREPER